MKTRQGFVSNSSSSSFIIGAAKVLDEKALESIFQDMKFSYIFTSEEEETKSLKDLSKNFPEVWEVYCDAQAGLDVYLCTKADIPKCEYKDGIERDKSKPRDWGEPYHPTYKFYLDEWGDLVVKAMTNDEEDCMVWLSDEPNPDDKYLIVSLHHGEDDGPFRRPHFEGLDTSVVNDAYFEKNFPKSFEILQLLMGKEGITEPLTYKFGVSRLG